MRLRSLMLPRPWRVPLGLALVGALAASLLVGADDARVAADCPPGTERPSQSEIKVDAATRARIARAYGSAAEIELEGTAGDLCWPVSRVESFLDLALRDAQHNAMLTAPYTSIPAGAREAAVAQRTRMAAAGSGGVWGADGTVEAYGIGPLIFDDADFDSGQGILDATGRIDDFKYDATTDRIFAAIGTGGLWMSEDHGYTWRSISDSLPTQTVGAVAYTLAGGPLGTVVAVTGEPTFGGGSFLGLGVWHSRDLGVTWKRSSGPKDGAFGFAAEVDPANPSHIYAATGKGLWRSTDAGVTFQDVKLPVGACQGDYNPATCSFAHNITDVVVKAPGGVGPTNTPRVMAVVGWRAGMMKDPDGTVQSPGNGIYTSLTGAPGSFTYKPGLGTATGGADHVGRTEFGPAVGDTQNHDIVYAIVQDATLMGGAEYFPGYDFLVGGSPPTYLNGLYVTENFGESWTLLADAHELSDACAANGSVYCIPGLVEPGAQSWYNQWIIPDPSKTAPDGSGVPSRLLFGLEEVWSTVESVTPKNTRGAAFRVIGSYYGSVDCLLVATDCGANRAVGTTTTHPDQQSALLLPLDNGGAELLVGNDGGMSRQTVDALTEFSQGGWVLRQRNGLQTLLPYSVAVANDGVAYAGLQDNGHMRIDPSREFAQFETYGGDGTFALVDPANSNYAWESVPGGNMRHTIDGGRTWVDAAPPTDDDIRFVTQAAMDPLDPNHIVTGGSTISETIDGPDTETTFVPGTTLVLDSNWEEPFVLGDSSPPDGVEAEPNVLSSLDVRGSAVYVGYCGVCDTLNTDHPFMSGIATNIGGDAVPAPGSSAGWHHATAAGLPDRYITGVAIDPYDASQRTVYVTLGGYSRSWHGPGTSGDTNPNIGTGHVYKSIDGGETFFDISGNLPDTPALTIAQRGDQLLIGTDIGAFISSDRLGSSWAVLGNGDLPPGVIFDIAVKQDDPDVVLLADYGRGVLRYRFPDADVTVARRSGHDRVATAVEASKAQFESADTVVIATKGVYADALAGVPLAHQLGAPMLLTDADLLRPEVKAEIARLGATKAVILGGIGSVSANVEAALSADGLTITRYGGASRYETAHLIAQQMDSAERVFVVEGEHASDTRGWPDALSVGSVAAVQGWPILLTRSDELPDATAAALDSLGTTSVTVVGGTGAISSAVVAQLSAHAGIGDRIAGADRYATNVALAELGQQRGLSVRHVLLASGTTFPDGLVGGAVAVPDDAVLLLVDRDDLAASAATALFLARHACQIDELDIIGGTASVSETVRLQVEGLLQPCRGRDPQTPPTPDPYPGILPPPDDAPTSPLYGPFGFEADAQGWTVSAGGADGSTWERSAPGHDSTTGFQVSPYANSGDTNLTSPLFDATGAFMQLDWWNQYDVEDGFDQVDVQWSDGGGPWQLLATVTGTESSWVVQHARFRPKTATFQVRFHFTSDDLCSSTPDPSNPDELLLCSGSYDGFHLDDVALQTVG